eukprot:scaffold29951_cov28-Tisochrysis_lutea.AAC.1
MGIKYHSTEQSDDSSRYPSCIGNPSAATARGYRCGHVHRPCIRIGRSSAQAQPYPLPSHGLAPALCHRILVVLGGRQPPVGAPAATPLLQSLCRLCSRICLTHPDRVLGGRLGDRLGLDALARSDGDPERRGAAQSGETRAGSDGHAPPIQLEDEVHDSLIGQLGDAKEFARLVHPLAHVGP